MSLILRPEEQKRSSLHPARVECDCLRCEEAKRFRNFPDPRCHAAWSSVLLGNVGAVLCPVAGRAVPVGPGHPLPHLHRGEAGCLSPAGRVRGDGEGAGVRVLPHLRAAQRGALWRVLPPLRNGAPVLPAQRSGEAAALADARAGGVHGREGAGGQLSVGAAGGDHPRASQQQQYPL